MPSEPTRLGLVLIVGNGWVAGGCGRMILIDIGIIM